MGAVAADPDGELRAALALAEVPRLGPATIRLLIDQLGSAREVLSAASRTRLPPAAMGFPHPRLLERLRGIRPVTTTHLDRLRIGGTRVISYGTPEYPESLSHLHHPPPVLYVRGGGELDQPGAVAIVGTRQATEYGRRLAGDIANGIARAGHAVVSGLARGIDAAAHRACLASGGITIGVLGSGLDHRYPKSSADLYRQVPERGLLVSEFSPEIGPRAGFFPRRNRIIAALVSAVVVVQAGRKSGALITVAHALELGRDVFAVPGPVGIPASDGVHELLRDGAAVATSADDVLRIVADATDPSGSREPPGGEEPDERGRLMRLLSDGLADVDEISGAIRLPPGRTLALLSMLELEGRVRALPGGRFGPIPHGGG